MSPALPRIALASSSPRRAQLLRQVHIPFGVIVPEANEDLPENGDVPSAAAVLAERKLAAALPRAVDFRWVMAMDTLVELEDVPLGKPRDRAEASSMLERLAGRSHRVHTAVALWSVDEDPASHTSVETCTTEVRFRALAPQEIRGYLDTDEWRGVAGAYRIQERGAFLVDSIRGSYSNVVGLPLSLVYGMLRASRYPIFTV